MVLTAAPRESDGITTGALPCARLLSYLTCERGVQQYAFPPRSVFRLGDYGPSEHHNRSAQ
jgi:hypothetical protein